MIDIYESNESDVDDAQPILNPMTAEILQAAQSIYQSYYQTHSDAAMAPLGVVVDQKTLRGQLIFTGQPILLPHECFIPTEQLGYYDTDAEEEYWE